MRRFTASIFYTCRTKVSLVISNKPSKKYLIYFAVSSILFAGFSFSFIDSSNDSQGDIESPEIQNQGDIEFITHTAGGGGGCVPDEEEGIVCRGDEIEVGPFGMRSMEERTLEMMFSVTDPEGNKFICTSNMDCEDPVYELDRVERGSTGTHSVKEVVIGEELEEYKLLDSAEGSVRIPDDSYPGTYQIRMEIYWEGELEGLYEDDFEISDEETEEEEEEDEIPEDAEIHEITVDMPSRGSANVKGLVEGEKTVGTEEEGVYKAYEGKTVEITPEPEHGYMFFMWLSEGVCDEVRETDNTCVIEMEEDEKVVGVFRTAPEDEESSLSIEVFEGGTVSVNDEEIPGGTSRKELVFDQGEEVSLEAEPGEGFEFQGWIGRNLRSMEKETSIVLDEDMYISADFARIEHEIDFSVEGEGSVVPSEHKMYRHGEEVEITAVPSAGFRFKEWGGDISSDDQSTSFEITDNMDIDAVFERTGYVLEVNHVGDGNGRTTPEEGEHVFEEGETVDIQISAVEDTNTFEGFEGDVDCEGNVCTVEMPDEDIEADVRFEDGGTKVDLDEEGESCEDYDDGTPVKRSGHIHGRYCYGGVARYCPENVVGIGDDPSLCEEEDDDGETSIYGCVDMDIDDKFCGTCGNECPEGYVCEERQCKPSESLFEVDIDIDEGGSVMLEETMFSVEEQIEITANPMKGYNFLGWEGDVEEPDEPTNIFEMDGDIELEPEFEKDTRTIKVYGLPDGVDEPGEVDWNKPDEFGRYSLGEEPVEKEVQVGKNVKMVFGENEGYKINDIRGDECEDINRICEFEVPEGAGNVEIVVEFEEEEQDLDDSVDSYEIEVVHEGEGKTYFMPSHDIDDKVVFDGEGSWSLEVYDKWEVLAKVDPDYTAKEFIVDGEDVHPEEMVEFKPEADSKVKVVFE